MVNTLEKILARTVVDNQTGCWLWQNSLHGKGYGHVGWNNTTRKVHRVVYELIRGPVDPSHDLHHTCHRKSCCNPDHLEPIPHGEHTTLTHFKELCRYGHPLAGDNLTVTAGRRTCRTCHRRRCRAYDKRQREKLS